jgi:hypothetical protein
MNASQITHNLKVAGFNQSMALGIVVIAAISAAGAFLYANRQSIGNGLFGPSRA